jgi:hypothetical protein
MVTHNEHHGEGIVPNQLVKLFIKIKHTQPLCSFMQQYEEFVIPKKQIA